MFRIIKNNHLAKYARTFTGGRAKVSNNTLFPVAIVWLMTLSCGTYVSYDTCKQIKSGYST